MCEVVQLHHRKSLEMKLRVMLLKSGKQIGEITERQLGIQPARNMELCRAFFYSFTGNPQAVVNVMRVGVGLSRCAIKAAKLAVGVANIRRIEVAVNIEISGAAMLAAANAVGEFAQGRQVVGCEQSDAVFK